MKFFLSSNDDTLSPVGQPLTKCKRFKVDAEDDKIVRQDEFFFAWMKKAQVPFWNMWLKTNDDELSRIP